MVLPEINLDSANLFDPAMDPTRNSPMRGTGHPAGILLLSGQPNWARILSQKGPLKRIMVNNPNFKSLYNSRMFNPLSFFLGDAFGNQSGSGQFIRSRNGSNEEQSNERNGPSRRDPSTERPTQLGKDSLSKRTFKANQGK